VSTMPDRLPLPSLEDMTEAQRAAANELIAGPRKAVVGPFIPLLRSPELMSRLQKVGDYLRFDSALAPRITEFATLLVSRSWSQQFEWAVHVPLARQAGIDEESIEAVREGRRPASLPGAQAVVLDFVTELTNNKGVAQATYDATLELLGEQGLIDLIGTVGYFTWMSMLLNVAHTPARAGSGIEPLPEFPR